MILHKKLLSAAWNIHPGGLTQIGNGMIHFPRRKSGCGHQVRCALLAAAVLISLMPVRSADTVAEFTVLDKQVSELYAAKKYLEAVPLAERKLKISEILTGKSSPDTATNLNSLAELYEKIGEYARAVPIMQRSLAICEKALGPQHPATADSLNILGKIYFATGDYGKAEPLFRRALAIRQKMLGSQNLTTASSLNALGLLYDAIGDYVKAESFYKRALEIYEKVLGPQDATTANALNNLASLYEAKGDYGKAEPLFKRALGIHEKTLGPQDPDIAPNLNNLAALYIAMGEYDKAELLFQRALAIYGKSLGPQHPATARTLSNLALLYEKKGDYGKAELLYKQTLDIREKALGPEHPETGLNLDLLGSLYSEIGDYKKAEPLLRRALAIHEKTLGAQHREVATSLNNLAHLYETIADYMNAEPLYKQALEVNQKALGPQHPETANSLNNLAVLYREMDDYARSDLLFQRALAIREKTLGSQHPDTGNSLDNLGSLYKAMGDFAKAEPLLKRALAIREKSLGPQHPTTAATLEKLASLYMSLRDYDKAEPLFNRALAICEKALGPQHSQTASNLNSLGMLYYAKRAYAKAEPLLQRALAIREKTHGPQHPETATSLNNLAELYESMGQISKAEGLMQRALTIFERALGAQHSQTATMLSNISLLNLELGKIEKAEEFARRADKAQSALLGNILSFTSEQQRLTFQKHSDPFSLSANLGDAPEIAAAILHNKGIVLDSLQEDRLVAEASGDPANRKIIDQLRATKMRLTHLLMEVPKNLSEDAKKSRDADREALTREVEKLEAGLAGKLAGLGKARRALGITVKEVQGALSSDQVLIELLRYQHYLGVNRWENRYGAVVIAAGGEPRWIPLATAAVVEKSASVYGKSVHGASDQTTLKNALQALHEQLWAPIEKALPADTKTIIISPDGELNFISFATLIAPDDRFLAEKYSIRYLSSGRDLLREIKPSTSKLMVVVGDPDFVAKPKEVTHRSAGVETSGQFRSSDLRDFNRISLLPLHGAAAECAALKNLAKSSGVSTRVIVGGQATEEQLRRVESPRVLHLATHGFFLPESKSPQADMEVMSIGNTESQPLRMQVLLTNPMHRCGLALAGAQHTLDSWSNGEVPPPENDGIVTAEEAGGLKL